MKRVWKFLGIAALVAVLGAGAVAAAAYAQGSTGETAGVFDFYERFRQTLAGILGITLEQYDSAVAQARDQTLQQAVDEGWLTQDQADQMRQRMEKAPEGMPWGGLGRGFGRLGPWDRGASLSAIAAEKLGMTEADLVAALKEGQTIAALAAEKGVDPQAIVDAYMAKVAEGMQQAVSEGRLTQKMADALLEQMRTQVTERLNATWSEFGPFGPGHPRGGGRGPWGCPDGGTEGDAGSDS